MSPTLCTVLVLTVFPFCRANDVFPETLVFKGLGLADMTNNSAIDRNHNDTIVIIGDLNNALITMNFHRYYFHSIILLLYYTNYQIQIPNTFQIIPNLNVRILS